MKKSMSILEDKKRLQSLQELEVLNTDYDQKLYNIALIASTATNSSISYISFINDRNQFIKAAVGIPAAVVPIEESVCQHLFNSSDSNSFLEIPDLVKDERTKYNHKVIDDANLKFYAGQIISDKNDKKLGSICVMDSSIRKLSKTQKKLLELLAQQVSILLTSDSASKQHKIKKREYRSVLNNINESIFKLDIFGNITYANPHAWNKFELSERSNSSITLLFSPKDAKRFSRELTYLLEGKKKSSESLFKLQSKSRKIVFMEMQITLVGKGGKNKHFIVTTKDVTLQKQRTEKLKMLSAIAQNTTNIVFILDYNFTLKWSNEAFCNLFNIQKNKIIGRSFTSVLSKINPKNKNSSSLNKFICSNYSSKVVADVSIFDKDGKEYWLSCMIEPMQTKKNVNNYIFVAQNITEKKKRTLKFKNQHKELIQSLSYASKIQGATLPTLDFRKNLNASSFVINLPKNVVGGDFYVAEKVQTSEGEVEIFAAADCTGHGVPGAMLSILCSNLLIETLYDTELRTSGEILTFVKTKLHDFLQLNVVEKVYDGMDIALLAINRQKKEIQFSGANRPLYRISNGKLIITKGDRQSIGYSRNPKPFKTHFIKYLPNDQFYIFSDGIVDQFGGKEDRKFMSKRLKAILMKSFDLNQKNQQIAIRNELKGWQGANEQTDDICMMGIAIS